MKRGILYTVFFMLILSLVLTAGLALANYGLRPVINSNAELAEKAAILDVFGIQAEGSTAIETAFAEQVAAAQNSSATQLYVKLGSQNSIEAIAVPFTGAGLWGQIVGYIGMSPDLDTITGIVFTEQNETPGLGGRIEEAQYRDQFRNLGIVPGVPISYDAPEYSQLDAIAGATSSSRAVLNVLNQFIEAELDGLTDGLEVIQ